MRACHAGVDRIVLGLTRLADKIPVHLIAHHPPHQVVVPHKVPAEILLIVDHVRELETQLFLSRLFLYCGDIEGLAPHIQMAVVQVTQFIVGVVKHRQYFMGQSLHLLYRLLGSNVYSSVVSSIPSPLMVISFIRPRCTSSMPLVDVAFAIVASPSSSMVRILFHSSSR